MALVSKVLLNSSTGELKSFLAVSLPSTRTRLVSRREIQDLHAWDGRGKVETEDDEE